MVNDGPKSIEETLRGAGKDHRIKVINTENDSLDNNGTWGVIKPVGLPTKVRLISWQIVLQDNVGAERCVVHYKTRLVAHRVCQRPGIYFGNTYSPTISYGRRYT